MPNYCFNEVTIETWLSDAMNFFHNEDDKFYFNMTYLYPWVFQIWNSKGTKGWDWDWMEKNTWTRSLPEIEILPASNENKTVISYETAWTPNNWALLKLSRRARVKVTNIYEERNEWFCWTYVCENGMVFVDNERECLGLCGCCEEDFEYEDLVNNDRYWVICEHCIWKLNLKIHCPCCSEEVVPSEMDEKVVYCPECRERFPKDEAIAF